MSKQALNVKAVKKIISDRRVEGKTDQEIYNELSPTYYDKKGLVLLITGTPLKETQDKYKVHNYILLSLIGIVILLKMFDLLYYFGLTELKIISEFNLLIIGKIYNSIAVLLFAIYFFYSIIKYTASIYRLCGFMSIVGFTMTIGNGNDALRILINFIFCALVFWLSFLLHYRLFPNYDPKNLKKDSNGEYIL